MTKYNVGDDTRDNDVNDDGNVNNNSPDGLGSDGTIYNPITTPRSRFWSRGGGQGDDIDIDASMENYLYICWTIMYVISTL